VCVCVCVCARARVLWGSRVACDRRSSTFCSLTERLHGDPRVAHCHATMSNRSTFAHTFSVEDAPRFELLCGQLPYCFTSIAFFCCDFIVSARDACVVEYYGLPVSTEYTCGGRCASDVAEAEIGCIYYIATV
jgi:hypothetical protein